MANKLQAVHSFQEMEPPLEGQIKGCFCLAVALLLRSGSMQILHLEPHSHHGIHLRNSCSQEESAKQHRNVSYTYLLEIVSSARKLAKQAFDQSVEQA